MKLKSAVSQVLLVIALVVLVFGVLPPLFVVMLKITEFWVQQFFG